MNQTDIRHATESRALDWVCVSITSAGSRVTETRNLVRALRAAGFDVRAHYLLHDALHPISTRDGAIVVHQARTGTLARPPGVPVVARAMFETDRLPASWRESLRKYDAIWVPSEMNRVVFAAALPGTEVSVVPLTLDFDAFTPGAPPLAELRRAGVFTFLSIFDFIERKGWRELIEAWCRAFGPREPVQLVLKLTAIRRPAQMIEREVRRFAEQCAPHGHAPVRFRFDRLPAEAMPSLYTGADAYVSASRGEGWGLTYAEAIACGLPVIATPSGNVEFMDADDAGCRIVPASWVDIGGDGDLLAHDPGLYAGHRWLHADVDALAAVMRETVTNRAAARLSAAAHRERLKARFGPLAIARSVDDAVRRFTGVPLRRAAPH